MKSVPHLLEVLNSCCPYHCQVAAMAKLSLQTEWFQSTEFLCSEPFHCTFEPQQSRSLSPP